LSSFGEYYTIKTIYIIFLTLRIGKLLQVQILSYFNNTFKYLKQLRLLYKNHHRPDIFCIKINKFCLFIINVYEIDVFFIMNIVLIYIIIYLLQMLLLN